MESAGKVLMLVENLPVPFDRRVWQEANALKKAGFKVSVICPKGNGYEKSFEVIDDIYIYRHPLPIEAKRFFGYLLEYATSLMWGFILSVRVLSERGFDVIHACNPPDLLFLIALPYKFFLRKMFVFDHHDINPELYLAKGEKKGFFYKLLLLFEKLTFKTADVSIATNQSYKEIALTRGKKEKNNVFVVRSAPNIKHIERFISDEPHDIAIKKTRKYMIAYVGVMSKQDGIDYLLRAIDYIIHKERRNDISFVLIGKGPEWESLVRYAQELKLQDYVTFTGRLPDREMIAYLSACDICVNPDVVTEFNDKSTMNKILEYMAVGKPIVQFDMREGKYSAQDASLYAKPNDEIDFAKKILLLLEDEGLRKKMGEIGKARIKNDLSWDNSEKELIKAYNYLFAKKEKN